MARNPALPDGIGITLRYRGEIRDLRARSRARSVGRTFIVGGSIDTGTYIPPLSVTVDADGSTPEWKKLYGFLGVLHFGTITVSWELNGVEVATQTVTTLAPVGIVTLDTPIDLAHGDTVRPVITDDNGVATDLSATVVFIEATD